MKRDIIESVLRHFLNGLGVWLAAEGYLDEATFQQIAGAVLTIFAIVWSFHDKSRRRPASGGL